jgi:hypothetical protein
MDNTSPHLFYTNVKIIMHNKNIFQNTLGKTFTFLAHDVHTKTCPFHFKSSNLSFKWLVYIMKFWLRKNASGIMCKEL